MAGTKIEPSHRVGFALADLQRQTNRLLAGQLTAKQYLKDTRTALTQLSKGLEGIRKQAKKGL